EEREDDRTGRNWTVMAGRGGSGGTRRAWTIDERTPWRILAFPAVLNQPRRDIRETEWAEHGDDTGARQGNHTTRSDRDSRWGYDSLQASASGPAPFQWASDSLRRRPVRPGLARERRSG